MVIKCVPEFSQQAMENVLQGIDDTEVYYYKIKSLSTCYGPFLAIY